MLNSLSSLVGLKSLKELILGHNQLSGVKDLGDLTNLVVLDISHNKLNDLDKLTPLKALLKLKVLCVQENPLCTRIPKYEAAVQKLFHQSLIIDPDILKDFS
jgi:Leucine-rich repeat (LRR) protein